MPRLAYLVLAICATSIHARLIAARLPKKIIKPDAPREPVQQIELTSAQEQDTHVRNVDAETGNGIAVQDRQLQEEQQEETLGRAEVLYDLEHLPFETDLAGRAQDHLAAIKPDDTHPLWTSVANFWPFSSQKGSTTETSTDGSVVWAKEAPSQNISRPKPIMWIHIHKAGGTFMCALAKLAGEVVISPSDNACNWKGYDQYRNSGKKDKPSCEERAQHFEEQNATWGQIEREFDHEDRCWESFDYGVTLREPLSLLQSEINYHPGCSPCPPGVEGLGGCWLFGGPCGGGPSNPEKFLKQLNTTLTSPHKKAENEGGNDQFPLWKFFDNYQVRLLAPALNVTAGGINETHLEAARKTLSNFSAVVRLEDMPHTSSKLFKALQWNKNMTKHVGDHVNPASGDFNFTEEQTAWLKDVNKWDVMLYESYGINHGPGLYQG